MRETVNGAFSLEVPEGFHVMRPEELKRMYLTDDARRWGIWDQDRHVAITALWKQYPAIITALSNRKALVKRNEIITRRGYAGHEYQLQGFFSTEIFGDPVDGYRFFYRLGEVEQAVETVLFLCGRDVYNLSCVGRRASAQADQELFHDLLRQIERIRTTN